MAAAEPVCLVVTGASRGLGRAIAVTLCRKFLEEGLFVAQHPHAVAKRTGASPVPSPQAARHTRFLHAVLVARSVSGLQETAQEIRQLSTSLLEKRGKQASPHSQQHSETSLTISELAADLSDLTTLDTTLDVILQHCSDSLHVTTTAHDAAQTTGCLNQSRRLVFVNNAGSLGHVGLCIDTPTLSHLKQAIDLNVTSSLWMSLRIQKWAMLQAQAMSSSTAQHRLNLDAQIVNISSLCAMQPTPTMALYSAGKAARDSYHTAMALESENSKQRASSNVNEDHGGGGGGDGNGGGNVVRILNYAPGPLEGTDMTTTLRQCNALDANLQPHFQKQLVDPMASAAVLAQLLQDDTFVNGAHVDYYDCL